MDNKTTIAILCLTIILGSLLYVGIASASLGTFKQNDCVNIVTNLNTSYVNISVLSDPSPNSTVIITNQAMTKIGETSFNYTFCNTSKMGTYTYGYCNADGDCYSNDFIINGSGQIVTSEQITLLLTGIVILLVFATFFFILSFIFKHPGPKIFFMALSALTLIVIIALIVSNYQVYLAEYPTINSIFSNYYVLMMILAGVAMMGLVVWLIYYAVTQFSKLRVGNIEDD